MSNFMAEPIALFPIRPQRSISVIDNQKVVYEYKGYVTISEDAADTLEITQHPVQQGATITDHAYKKPNEVTIKFLKGDQNGTPLAQSYADLLALQDKRTLLRVVTGKRTYNNMLIRTLAQVTDKSTENVLSVTISFQEVIIVQVVATVLPKRGKQANAGKTGATEKAGKKSALRIFKNGISDFFGGLK